MEAIESQQHMQNLNQPSLENPQNLGFHDDSSSQILSDSNLQNPNHNLKISEGNGDDDADVAVQKTICEELQSLVLNQAFVEEVSEGGKSVKVKKSENGWGDDCYDDGYYNRSENVDGFEAGWKEGGFNENGGEAGWKEVGFNENGDKMSWKEGAFNENGDELGWKEGSFNEYGDGAGWKEGRFNENGDEAGWKGEGGFNGSRKSFSYPLRPDAADCAYYMKTGACKYGSNCKFNHPSRARNLLWTRENQPWTRETGKQREESEERSGQIECKYYLSAGGCKYGIACKYNHSRAKGISSVLDFNFLGLPVRLGEKECPYYMRTGSCKYGSNCRFHHPDPSTLAGVNPSSGYNNGGSAPVQSASYPTAPSWSSPRALNEAAPFVPVVYPASQGIPSLSPQWNGYQAPAYSIPEKSLPAAPAFTMKDLATKTNFYPQPQQPWLVEEYPERPGQLDCSYFIKTGDCKYKSNCKFNHPKAQVSKRNSSVLNDKGLPLRPDQAVCSFYSRYGICKFGPACKFDHPENYVSSPSSGSEFYQPPFGNCSTTDGSRMARKPVVL